MGGSASKPQDSKEPVVERVVVLEPPTPEGIEESAANIIWKAVRWPIDHYRGLLWAYPIRIVRMKKPELDDLEKRLIEDFQRVHDALKDKQVTFNLCDEGFQNEILDKMDSYRDALSEIIIKIAERRKALTPDGDDW